MGKTDEAAMQFLSKCLHVFVCAFVTVFWAIVSSILWVTSNVIVCLTTLQRNHLRGPPLVTVKLEKPGPPRPIRSTPTPTSP